jgi:hypothetical protein
MTGMLSHVARDAADHCGLWAVEVEISRSVRILRLSLLPRHDFRRYPPLQQHRRKSGPPKHATQFSIV